MTMKTQSVPVTHDESPIKLPMGLPFIRKETNRKLIRSAWKAAGVSPRYPISTPEVFAILSTIGYRVDEACLHNAIKTGNIKRPERLPVKGKQGRQYAWSEANIIEFADYLESIRRWLPVHPMHVHKMNRKEIAEGTKEQLEKRVKAERYLKTHPKELLAAMVGEDNQQTRSEIAYALSVHFGFIHLRGTEKVSTHETQDN